MEAATRRAEFGANSFPEPKLPGLTARIGGQLRDPLILVLIAAMTVTAARDVGYGGPPPDTRNGADP